MRFELVLSRAMTETNKDAHAASSRVPLRSTTAVGDVRLAPDRSSRCVAASPHSRLVRGGVGGRKLERHSALGLGSHGRLSRRGIADSKFVRCRRGEGLLPAISPPPRRKLLLSHDAENVHHSPNTLCLALLLRVLAHRIASIDALSDCN